MKAKLITARLTILAKQLTLAAVLGGLACAAAAHELTFNECLEGSDFIMHAAMSRDNGISREVFIERMQSDFGAIRAFPPDLRWFAQDADDEALLMEAAQLVFDSPHEPESHQSEFLQFCMERVGASGADPDSVTVSPAAAIVPDAGSSTGN
jgi:hypothetical protein